MTIDIVDPEKNFRGMTYGDWAEVWSNWLFSGYPNYVPDDDMLFCRGFLEFAGRPYDITQQQYLTERPVSPAGATKKLIRTTETRFVLNKDVDSEPVDLSDRVPTGTALFFPLITAMYSIGNKYEGRTLDNEFDLRRAVMKDTYESREAFFKLTRSVPANPLPRGFKIVPAYRFETSLFTLRISESSPFIGYQHEEVQPGIYETVTGGYFVIIADLPQGEYTFEFGGKGRDGYRTKAIHKVVVSENRRSQTIDTSRSAPTPLI